MTFLSTVRQLALGLRFSRGSLHLKMQTFFMQRSFEAPPHYTDGVEDILMSARKFIMTFSSVIDRYHSHVLRDDTSTSTWVRTVGYQNNSLNVGYTTVSAADQLTGVAFIGCNADAVACACISFLINEFYFVGPFKRHTDRRVRM